MKEVLISLFSGIIGVILTICYQHFFSPPQSFTFIYNGEEMLVTESKYTEIMDENNSIKTENEKLKQEYDSVNDLYIQTNKQVEQLNNQIAELQSKSSDNLETLKQQYETDINSKYDVDFQNISLIINGIDTKYMDRVAIINDEKYYSMGFLQYLVDNEIISDNNKKIFIGDIQSEEQMPISLFDFGDPFTKGKIKRTTDDKDYFNEIRSGQPEFKVVVGTLHYDDIRNATEYYLAGEYTKFTFETAYSINADQSRDYEIVILGDDRQLKSVTVDRKSHIQKIEVDVTGVNYLQIIGKGNIMGSDSYYSLMLEPYLYP